MSRLDRVRDLIAGSGSARPRATSESSKRHDATHLEQTAEALGGVVEMAPAGPSVIVRRVYPATEQYGRRTMDEYPRPVPNTLAAVGGLPHVVHADGTGALYFDLETTGLSGGAGTVAFLVGCGWFEGDAFHTHQYFLPTLAAEPRMLRTVSSRLERAATLITFNGKSFDVPITDARFAFHRLASPLDQMLHVDLLHPARRLWSEGETRLAGLERAVLGVHRSGDVPGSEIPARYVAYLRGGDPRLLSSVLEHNRLDLVSLGLLTGLACAMVGTGVDATRSATQALGLGRLYERAGRRRDAIRCYRAAAGSASPSATRAEALRRLALSYRRDRRYVEAAAQWHELLTIPGVPPALASQAHVALAVHHEHRSRDLVLAERLAAGALAREEQPRRREALRHRVQRLARKLAQTADGTERAVSLLQTHPDG